MSPSGRSAWCWCRGFLLFLFGVGGAGPAFAQDGGYPAWAPHFLGWQATFIGQSLARFESPYAGPNSLTANGDQGLTDTYGIYLGARLADRLGAYVDVEMARGNGISHATGLGGITNGDVIRQGTANLSRGPYLARFFLRYSVPLGPDSVSIDRGPDQFPGAVPASRLEIDAGKLAASDFLDLNRYANSTRTQFMNWGLFNNTAWDFAADTRGYTYGVAISLIHPAWTLVLGSFMMPTRANGNQLDTDVGRARGDNLELTLRPGGAGTVVRWLAYRNQARMGDYLEAIARAASGVPPNIVAADRPGRTKNGFGVNVEQPIADGGETGAFLRAGWNDGHTEDFAFTEVDRHLSAGLQVAGGHWGRGADRLGIAAVLHGLSTPHRDYLAAGGKGFLLGGWAAQLRFGADCRGALPASGGPGGADQPRRPVHPQPRIQSRPRAGAGNEPPRGAQALVRKLLRLVAAHPPLVRSAHADDQDLVHPALRRLALRRRWDHAVHQG